MGTGTSTIHNAGGWDQGGLQGKGMLFLHLL